MDHRLDTAGKAPLPTTATHQRFHMVMADHYSQRMNKAIEQGKQYTKEFAFLRQQLTHHKSKAKHD